MSGTQGVWWQRLVVGVIPGEVRWGDIFVIGPGGILSAPVVGVRLSHYEIMVILAIRCLGSRPR